MDIYTYKKYNRYYATNHVNKNYFNFNYHHNKIICLNCDQEGHGFKDCKKPIISYGIIVSRLNILEESEYLLIQRKDSVSFIDLIRGKYNTCYKNHHKTLIEETTDNERKDLLINTFDSLWNKMWINKKSRTYINEYSAAKLKYEKLDIEHLINSSDSSRYIDTGWSFCKGRKSHGESKLECALREFCEESGYTKNDIEIINCDPLEETYYGSNTICYKHVYYLAKMKTDREPTLDNNNILQSGEIKDIRFFLFKDAINIFRSYYNTKRNVLYKAHKIITEINEESSSNFL